MILNRWLGCPRNCAGEEADPFGDDLYVDIDQASEVTCSSPECSSVDSISTSCGNWGASSQSR